jgi:hypothetical protein
MNAHAITAHYDTPEAFESTASKTSPNRDCVIVILHSTIRSKKGGSQYGAPQASLFLSSYKRFIDLNRHRGKWVIAVDQRCSVVSSQATGVLGALGAGALSAGVAIQLGKCWHFSNRP